MWVEEISTLHAPRSTLHAPRSTLHAPRSPLYTFVNANINARNRIEASNTIRMTIIVNIAMDIIVVRNETILHITLCEHIVYDTIYSYILASVV
jgi:hypothetical protein